MTDSRTLREQATPLDLELLESGGFRQYLVHSKTEIVFILRTLQRTGAWVSVYLGQDNNPLLTSVLAVDEQGLTLDVGPDDLTNRKALASRSPVFVASHERVKIQFATKGLSETTHQERAAFRTDLPESLLRLQRREYYRLAATSAPPLKCVIPIRAEDGSERTLEARVLDISGSGVALVVPPEGVPFGPEMRFEGCRIDLPEVGAVTMTLEVRHTFEITLRKGVRGRRAGCRFIDMPEAMRSVIQRYITSVERERRARQRGLR